MLCRGGHGVDMMPPTRYPWSTGPGFRQSSQSIRMMVLPSGVPRRRSQHLPFVANDMLRGQRGVEEGDLVEERCSLWEGRKGIGWVVFCVGLIYTSILLYSVRVLKFWIVNVRRNFDRWWGSIVWSRVEGFVPTVPSEWREYSGETDAHEKTMRRPGSTFRMGSFQKLRPRLIWRILKGKVQDFDSCRNRDCSTVWNTGITHRKSEGNIPLKLVSWENRRNWNIGYYLIFSFLCKGKRQIKHHDSFCSFFNTDLYGSVSCVSNKLVWSFPLFCIPVVLHLHSFPISTFYPFLCSSYPAFQTGPKRGIEKMWDCEIVWVAAVGQSWMLN
jgi:hypothetical protein